MNASSQMPRFDQVAALPRYHEFQLPKSYEDPNGHVNVRHYAGIYDDAGWKMYAALGIDQLYIEQRNQGVFDIEQHLKFVEEVAVDETVAVHTRWLAQSDKIVHGMSFLLNVTTNSVVNTLEFIAGHVDLSTRRVVPFPAHVTSRLEEEIARFDGGWTAPVCGALGIRSRQTSDR